MSRSKPLILSVDDVPENIHVIKGILTPEYAVAAATRGDVALKIAEAQQPDLVLLDVMMPEMDGHEVCRRLKANPATAHIPVIFVTAMGEEKDEAAGLRMGAVDYVTKPISPLILQSRVRVHAQLTQARQELDAKNRQLEEERLFLETLVQLMQSDERFDTHRLATLFKPLERTGGDMILSARRPDGGHHLMVADFTGHGLPASMGGSLVAYIFYDMTARGCPAEQVLTQINAVLQQKLPVNIYMAAVMAELPPGGGRLRLWNAGLPDALVRGADGSWRHAPSSLLALGIVEEVELSAVQELAFGHGDCCYLFSDGLIETENAAGELLGIERLKEAIDRSHTDGRSIGGLLELASAHAGERGQLDDLTLVELCGD